MQSTKAGTTACTVADGSDRDSDGDCDGDGDNDGGGVVIDDV